MSLTRAAQCQKINSLLSSVPNLVLERVLPKEEHRIRLSDFTWIGDFLGLYFQGSKGELHNSKRVSDSSVSVRLLIESFSQISNYLACRGRIPRQKQRRITQTDVTRVVKLLQKSTQGKVQTCQEQ